MTISNPPRLSSLSPKHKATATQLWAVSATQNTVMAMLHMYCGLVGPVQLHAPEGHLTTVLPHSGGGGSECYTWADKVGYYCTGFLGQKETRTAAFQWTTGQSHCLTEPSLSLTCLYCLRRCTRLSRQTLVWECMYAASKDNVCSMYGAGELLVTCNFMGPWQWNEPSDEVGARHDVCHKRRMSPVWTDNAFVTS